MAAKSTGTATTPSSSAFLSSFYIYNPSLGHAHVSLHEQLIFHYSSQTTRNRLIPKDQDDSTFESQELDRRLRAIGLAQGIVEFARAFSPCSPVQEIRTQKGFTLPVEVEKCYWMLATIEAPGPSPTDLVSPSLLCRLLRRAYRLQRMQFRTFKYLLHAHALQHLISTVTPYYNTFLQTINLSLSSYTIEVYFDAVRWSYQHLDHKARCSVLNWLRQAKSQNSNIIDVLIFRAPKDILPYESQQDGMIFSGLQDGTLSSENIRDISLYLSTLDIHKAEGEVRANGDAVGSQPVSLPGPTPAWDSVVQTSSSLFSALSFRTVPAKWSSSGPPDNADTTKTDIKTSADEGCWVIGGDKEGHRIWLEVSEERLVPISMGNEQPGFLRDLSDQQSPGDDGLVEVELFAHKFNDLLTVFIMYPSCQPPDSFKPVLQCISETSSIPRPTTPLSLKPFMLLHDPLTLRIYSTLPPIPPPPIPIQQSFSLTPKRTAKRDPWPRETAIEVYSHILRLREQYDRKSRGRKVREYTAKTTNFFIFRTLIPTDERTMADFAEGWYIVKTGQTGQSTGSGLGRGDDAGGLEDIAKTGREKCREIWKQMNIQYTSESDEE